MAPAITGSKDKSASILKELELEPKLEVKSGAKPTQ